MGEVYRSTDTKLSRDVAIELLPAEFASDPDRMARFHREAQVLFLEKDALLGVFVTPGTFDGVGGYVANVFGVLGAVTVSPLRGLFFSAPVLLT